MCKFSEIKTILTSPAYFGISESNVKPHKLSTCFNIDGFQATWRKVYLYQKGDYESMRKDTLEFAKEKYFNGHSETRTVQENFCFVNFFYSRLGG